MLTIRRFGPMFILLFNLWSFSLNFTFGLAMLSLTIVACICIYHYAVKDWQENSQDELFELGVLNISEKE